jgi:hypothetical protein
MAQTYLDRASGIDLCCQTPVPTTMVPINFAGSEPTSRAAFAHGVSRYTRIPSQLAILRACFAFG